MFYTMNCITCKNMSYASLDLNKNKNIWLQLSIFLNIKGEIMNELSRTSKGMIYMLIGFAVLLYAFGFMQRGFTLVIVCGALLLIISGAMKLGLHEKISKMIGK